MLEFSFCHVGGFNNYYMPGFDQILHGVGGQIVADLPDLTEAVGRGCHS
jgi:hypothetical protein